MQLRPYHNPENVDESKVPAGWRFRYADEAGTMATGLCRGWAFWRHSFTEADGYNGDNLILTYIVPVNTP